MNEYGELKECWLTGEILSTHGVKKDKRFMQNVILRRVRITNVAVENQYVLPYLLA